MIFYYTNLFMSVALIARGEEKKAAGVTFLALITSVMLNVLWIPENGAMGAAYAVLVSEGVITTVLLILLFQPHSERSQPKTSQLET